MSVIRCWICMLFSLLLVNMQSITVSGETCQAKTLLASELHYLADQCTEEMHARIASDFIALYTLYLGTIEGCDGNENCTIENFHVECGVRSITLRRRDIVNSEQASKVPLTLKFAVKVPLPSNASVIGQNQTTQQLSSKILDSLKETDRILNISGVVLEFDASKPPVARIVGLVRDRGQVLKGTKCVSCPRGYFFNATGCQPCAVDQYQDQEAQTSCVPCPSGTSTLGQLASERPEECRDNTPPSFNNTCPNNVVFYAAECLSSALLTWIEPMATDNSDQVSISYPAIRPPVNLSIGLYNVLYSAIDSSGNQANCTFIVQVARKSCPVLQPPIHGSIASLSCGTSFGSQASLACDTGYRMAGSRLRSCRADRTWSGNVTTCNIVKCPSIEAPSHGMVSPSTCKIPSGVNYQTECFFMCNVTVGYQLEGTPKVSCLENGSWSEDTTKTICRDIQAPNITCPPDMDNIPTEPGQSYAIVKWQMPVPTDNSNEPLKLSGLRPPQKLNVGKKNITYKVTDSSGLSRSCMFFIHVEANPCPDLPMPLNGAKTCDQWPNETSCILHCNVGFDFANRQPQSYVCSSVKGTWMPSGKVLDCSETHQAKALLASELHYLADQCTEKMHVLIASNFIALYTQYLGTIGGCDGDEKCTIENVQVKCGEHVQGISPGRRHIADSEQAFFPVTVKFAVKVPLPSNVSVVDLNQTTQQISSNILAALSETDLILNISGVVLEYDASKLPVVRMVHLVCGKGQVLKGTKCVNCPRGSFFNTTGCQACAVDQYQDQEAQTSCVPCPSGTSTLGQVESKTLKDCRERRKPARSNQTLIISVTVVGSLVLITLIVLVTVFVRKHYLRSKRMTSNAVTQPPSYGTEENMAGCFRFRSPALSLQRSKAWIQVENEADQDSTKCSNETLSNHLPTSLPKYITKVKDTFTSTGGELCAPLNSNVRIIVPSGAIPAGMSQPVFFGVFLDETTLLRDIPEAPDRTLISPLVECGPHDIHLSKPVEIIVPHCLCLSEAKKEWITVHRCGEFSAEFEGQLSWEKVPNKSEKSSQSKSWFTVEKDSIRIKTTTFSLWSIFACGGPRRKRATVFANRPDPKSDLIYLRFYVYSDNEDSKRRVELKDKERFPDSKPAREKPFRMYSDNSVITVKLTNLEEGWEFDKTDDTQIYLYEKASGNGFRSKDACDFAVKPEDGRDVNGFSCMVKFQQEDDDQEYSIYLNPGFTPLKRQSIRRSSAEGGRSDITSSNACAIAGGSTSTAPEEEDEYGDTHNPEGSSSQDSSPGEGSVYCDPFLSSFGSDDELISERLCFCISPYVGVNWKRVLRKLSMDEMIIRNLDEDYKNCKVAEKCYEGLLAWKESLGPQRATIKTLCEALRLVGCSEALKTLRREIASQNSDC